MKILVFSDTHGDSEDMVLTIMEQCPDAVFFLGDVLRDLDDVTCGFPDLPVFSVPGNCDYTQVYKLPNIRLIRLEGVTFFLCHGHTYTVKSGYSTAVSAAKKHQADVLLCGHTHIPHYDTYGALQVLNPGSLRGSHTYGLIYAEHGVARCSIQTLNETE